MRAQLAVRAAEDGIFTEKQHGEEVEGIWRMTYAPPNVPAPLVDLLILSLDWPENLTIFSMIISFIPLKELSIPFIVPLGQRKLGMHDGK